jgi:hypothetical protein
MRRTNAPPRPTAEFCVTTNDVRRLVGDAHAGNCDPVGDRARKEMGDIEGLAADLTEHGLIHPIGVRHTEQGHELVVGGRRLAAASKLGSKRIDVRVLSGVEDRLAAPSGRAGREPPPPRPVVGGEARTGRGDRRRDHRRGQGAPACFGRRDRPPRRRPKEEGREAARYPQLGGTVPRVEARRGGDIEDRQGGRDEARDVAQGEDGATGRSGQEPSVAGRCVNVSRQGHGLSSSSS